MNKKDIIPILFIPITLLSAIIPNKFGIWHIQYLGFLLVIFLMISFQLYNFNKWLVLFLLTCTFSTFFISKMNARSVVLLIQLYLGAVVAYYVSLSNQKTRKYINICVFALILLQILWISLQAWNKDPIFSSTANRKLDDMVGFSASANFLGTFFALTMPVSLSFNPLYGILNLIGLFISKSSFAFISGIVSGLVYLYYKNKKLFKIILLIILIIGGLFFGIFDKVRMTDLQTRFAVWQYALSSVKRGIVPIEQLNQTRMISCNPIFGYGFGNFLAIFPFIAHQDRFNYANEKFTHAHNDYVENFIFELGYIGIIVLLLMIINFILNFIKSKKDNELILYFSVMTAYLLNASGNFLSHNPVAGAFLIIYYGLYEGKRRELNGATTAICSRQDA